MLLPDRIRIGRSADSRRSSSACAMRPHARRARPRRSACASRQSASRCARKRPARRFAAQCSRRSVIATGIRAERLRRLQVDDAVGRRRRTACRLARC